MNEFLFNLIGVEANEERRTEISDGGDKVATSDNHGRSDDNSLLPAPGRSSEEHEAGSERCVHGKADDDVRGASDESERRFPEYRVSERVTLKTGDIFRAKGGPYYVGSSGKRIKMSEKGPFRFRCYCERGDQRWIEATPVRGGGFVVLSLTERESLLPGSLITRPYTISGRVTGRPLARLVGRKEKRKKRTVTIDAESLSIAKPESTKPDKADRRQASRERAARRAAGGRRAAINDVLAGVMPLLHNRGQ